LLLAVAVAPPALAAMANPVIAIEIATSERTAEWVAKEVALTFERALAKLAGLVSMNSISSNNDCLIELGYGGLPDKQTIEAARSVALSVWHELGTAISEPVLSVREGRLRGGA